MSMQQYTSTVARLARGGVKDPTAQIIALAEEIERYREKIRDLEDHIKTLTKAPLPKKLERHLPLGNPYIELRPTCSECGAPLEKVAAGHTYVEQPPISHYKVSITPEACPVCGAVFGNIVFQGELPGKEKA